MASICSVTFIEPSSAPIPAPTRPLTINPVMTGPLSLTIEKMMTAGSIDFAPNCVSVSRVCRERTTPVAAPASATKGNDFDPIASIWRISSPPSQGGTKATRARRQQNMPSSPNHAKNPIMLVSVLVATTFHEFGWALLPAAKAAARIRTRLR